MSLQQKAIRDALIALLGSALDPSVKVFRSPRREIAEGELPAVCVFSVKDRAVSDEDDHASVHDRIYTLRVEILAKGRAEEDVTEGLCDTIRAAVLLDDLEGLAHRISWAEQAWDGDEGEYPLARTALDFDFYYLFDTTPEAP